LGLFGTVGLVVEKETFGAVVLHVGKDTAAVAVVEESTRSEDTR
jgi:hypothetical protein